MASIDERIAALEAKLKQEKAKKQQIEARKRAALAKVSRQQDTRRKILVGAAILAKVERGEWPKDKLLAMLDAALTWHPNDVNEVVSGTNNSCIQVMYRFHGVSAHAAGDQADHERLQEGARGRGQLGRRPQGRVD